MKIQTKFSSLPLRAMAMPMAAGGARSRAVVRMILHGVQASLRVGAADDVYEREAERVAAAVTADAAFTSPGRVMAAGQPVQRMCRACEEELQRKPAQPQPAHADGIEAAELVGAGQAMPFAQREFFESRLGSEFSAVRIHHDQRAARLARSINARAFTHGADIYFDQGEYRPDTSAGRHLLAHELTHVVQQGAAPSAATPIQRRTAPMLQREPGQNADESWQALVTKVVEPAEAGRQARADEAIRRYLQTRNGQQLINQLWTLFFGRRGGSRSRIVASFLDQRRGGWDQAGGYFGPDQPRAREYRADVRNRFPPDPNERGRTLWGEWGSGEQQVSWTHTDPESDMANTLYHELLHVWFINTQTDLQGSIPEDPLHTGHGDPYQGEIHPLFARRYRAFVTELSDMETRWHREAAEAARRREQERLRLPAPVPAEPPRAVAPEPRASRVGGEVSLQGGAAGGGGLGARGSVILGADVVLRTLVDLRVGARGVYLTPDHLFAGGTVGMRWLQGEGMQGPVRNPMFFDLEAGVLAELNPTDSSRITDHIAGFGQVGVGQEFGRQGTRFFWRVGGFVVVTDRLDVIGGGSAGAGVRF